MFDLDKVSTMIVDNIPVVAGMLLKLVAAALIWWIGGKIIKAIMAGVKKLMHARELDSTLQKYLVDIIGAVLKILLVLAIVGYLGVDTTSFAALIAGAGLAIGTAWGDILKNFAAGAFLLVLRPFKVGDFIQAGGVMGTVEELGMIVTTINSLDNVKHIVGNNKIFSDTIVNYTTNDTRRVELLCQLSHGTDAADAIKILSAEVAKIPNVASTPAPEINILEFNLAGPVLSVRPYTHNDHYWQVYFDTNKVIRDHAGKAAGAGVPTTHYNINQQ